MLQLGLLDQGNNCALVLDSAQLPYLETEALFVYNALLQTGLIFMRPIIVQPCEHSCECLTVDNMSVANVSYSASMTHIYVCVKLIVE